MAKGAIGAAALLLLVLPICRAAPAVDPETGLMRVIYIGDCYGKTPYLYLGDEPLFSITPIPASTHENTYTEKEMRRHMRLYMPRTYDELVRKHEIVLLSDTGLALYRPDQLMWLKRGVIQGGQGILMVGGYQSFGGKAPQPSWRGSSVEDVLPVECLDAAVWETGSFRPVPADEEHEFATSLSWKGTPAFEGMNMVKTRDAATVVLEPHTGPDGPLLVYWEVGKGSGIAHTPDLTPGWGEQFMLWQYYGDYVSNLFYLLGRMNVPQDVDLMHAVRTSLRQYSHERSLITSLTEFVDRFGANLVPIERRLVEISEMKKEANRLYTEQEYEAVLTRMDEISTAISELGMEALRLKRSALFWVFLIEWLAVTGTFMVCTFILWGLMVRRRLYRDVEATRLKWSGGP